MDYVQKIAFIVAFIDERRQTIREMPVAIRPGLSNAPLWCQAISEAKAKCGEPRFSDAEPVCRHGQSMFGVCDDCKWDAVELRSRLH